MVFYKKIITKYNLIYLALIILIILNIDTNNKNSTYKIVKIIGDINIDISTWLKYIINDSKNQSLNIIKKHKLKFIKHIKYKKISKRYSYIEVIIFKPVIKIQSPENIYTLIESNEIVDYKIFDKNRYDNIKTIYIKSDIDKRSKDYIKEIILKILSTNLLNFFNITINDKEDIIFESLIYKNCKIITDIYYIDSINKIEETINIYKKIQNEVKDKIIHFDIRFKNMIILKRD
jgi:hypothetical protein